MSFSVIIPARLGSSRLPEKPLKDLGGKPMIQRVYEAASQSDAKQVIVATDHPRIEQVVKSFGGKVCMTKESHPSGTDRLQEVVQNLRLADGDIVVNVQGDEPLIPPSVINQVATNLAQHPDMSMATLSEPIANIEDCFNPNIVKVVRSLYGQALYFSRAPIPWVRDNYDNDSPVLPQSQQPQRHIGIYAYRVSLLHQFVDWPVSTLELLEKLEQLRVLENGHRIHIETACELVPGGVDTEEDLHRVAALFSSQIC